MTHPLERRRRATQATIDRFDGHPFEWGKFDCAKMVAHQLRGLRRPIPYAKAGRYADALGAARALKRLGHDTLGSLLDSKFEAIPPAACLLGDIIEFEADNPLGAMGIALGNNAAFMYHEETEGPVSCRIISALRGWRII